VKFYIGVDHQPQWVKTPEEATSVLAQTVLKARESVKATLEQGGTLKAPQLVGPPEIRGEVKAAQREINGMYRSARIDSELKTLMHRQMDREEDDDLLLFL
jgi:hypothetical protein